MNLKLLYFLFLLSGNKRNDFGSKNYSQLLLDPCILLLFYFGECIQRRLAKLLRSQIRTIVFPGEYLPGPVYTRTMGPKRRNQYEHQKHQKLLKQSP